MTPSVALSLRQPWAWVVVHGGKDIENRGWRTKRRGDFYIHAAKGCTFTEYRNALTFIARAGGAELVQRVPAFDALERGGIVGRATIVDVLKPCLMDCDVDDDVWCRCGHPWHMGDQYGFQIANVAALPFCPMRGYQNFFPARYTLSDVTKLTADELVILRRCRKDGEPPHEISDDATHRRLQDLGLLDHRSGPAPDGDGYGDFWSTNDAGEWAIRVTERGR